MLSPAFVLSPKNQFIADLALAMGITQQMRKLIPVVHKECVVPATFQHIIMLNFCRPHLYDFWSKLYESVMPLPPPPPPTLAAHRVRSASVRIPA